jgi:hypothetical protein
MPERTSAAAAPAAARFPVPSLLVAAGLVAFLALHVASAVAYPGGTSCNAGAVRYEVLGNFFCDLASPLTPLGLDNTVSARLATAAFVCVAMAMAPFWWLVGRLVGRWPGRIVFGLGALSAVATIGLGGLPSARWPMAHYLTVFAASLPGLAAAIVGAIGLLVAGRRGAGLAGLAVLILGAIDAAGYAHAVAAGIHCAPALPVLQKAAAAGLVAWMAAVAAIGARRPAPPPSPARARTRTLAPIS